MLVSIIGFRIERNHFEEYFHQYGLHGAIITWHMVQLFELYVKITYKFQTKKISESIYQQSAAAADRNGGVNGDDATFYLPLQTTPQIPITIEFVS